MSDLPTPEMHEEWDGWQNVICELQALMPDRFDVNGPEAVPLVKAVSLWGERLVAVRTQQPAEVRDQALREKLDSYAAVRTPR